MGVRIVRFVNQDPLLSWHGEERVVELELSPIGLWKIDPDNLARNFTYADECDIAGVISGLTRFTILGDFLIGGEGIAIDDIVIYGPDVSVQPIYPVLCRQGCPCVSGGVHPSCCG